MLCQIYIVLICCDCWFSKFLCFSKLGTSSAIIFSAPFCLSRAPITYVTSFHHLSVHSYNFSMSSLQRIISVDLYSVSLTFSYESPFWYRCHSVNFYLRYCIFLFWRFHFVFSYFTTEIFYHLIHFKCFPLFHEVCLKSILFLKVLSDNSSNSNLGHLTWVILSYQSTFFLLRLNHSWQTNFGLYCV